VCPVIFAASPDEDEQDAAKRMPEQGWRLRFTLRHKMNKNGAKDGAIARRDGAARFAF